MMNIRFYTHTDRYVLEKMIHELYDESKVLTPTDEELQKTIAFFNTFTQCGRVYVFEIDGELIGYSIVLNIWKNRFCKLCYLIDEIYVKKGFKKDKVESEFIDFLTETADIYGILIRFDSLNNASKKSLKNAGFDKDEHDLYIKIAKGMI